VGKVVTGSVLLTIDDPSRIAECRRLATVVAEREKLAPEAVANAALVAVELASNLWKHAQKGEIHFSPLSRRGHAGIEILCVDRGPGIQNLAASMRDGHSTTGTSGTGLGAVRRLSNRFDIHSQFGKGTILVSQIGEFPRTQETGEFEIGLAARPINGERVSGDAWSVRVERKAVQILVADGLGHGPAAAEASAAAVEAFDHRGAESPAEAVQVIHQSLRGTRGAAVAVANIDFSGGRVIFAGIGNIAGAIVTDSKVQSMVSHNGTAGHQVRHIREFFYPWTEGSIVIMHSDGVSAHWNPPATAAFQRHHPSVIAGLVYREAARDRDDVCVVAGRKL
jgi:anti-sigma regulatory factor (Ser/Thr protein kinase)